MTSTRRIALLSACASAFVALSIAACATGGSGGDSSGDDGGGASDGTSGDGGSLGDGASSDGPEGGSEIDTGCNANSCLHGCCVGSMCLAGTTSAQCGIGGGACADCTATGLVCNGQACGQTDDCSPSSCTGCCSGGVCALGLANNACGADGGSCLDCAALQLACLNGGCTQ